MIITIQRKITCPGLNLILLLYSSKYLTIPPIPVGIDTLSCDIVFNSYYLINTSINFKKLKRVRLSHLLSGPNAAFPTAIACLSIKLSALKRLAPAKDSPFHPCL